MSDPLSISAGVVGLTVSALHATRLLLDDLQNIKDAPKAVKRLEDDVQSVKLALKTLEAIEEREWEVLGTNVTEQSKTTISGCTEACDLFRSKLQRWTRSSDGKPTWQDRTKIGFFKQAQLKAISEQIQNCKLSINSTVSIATL